MSEFWETQLNNDFTDFDLDKPDLFEHLWEENNEQKEQKEQKDNNEQQERGSTKNPGSIFECLEFPDTLVLEECPYLSYDESMENNASPQSPMTSFQSDLQNEIGHIEKKLKMSDECLIQNFNPSSQKNVPQQQFMAQPFMNSQPFMPQFINGPNNMYFFPNSNLMNDLSFFQNNKFIHEIPPQFPNLHLDNTSAPLPPQNGKSNRKRKTDGLEICPFHKISIINSTGDDIKVIYEDGSVDTFVKKSSVVPKFKNNTHLNRFRKDYNKNHRDVLCFKSKHKNKNCHCIDSLKNGDCMKNGHNLYVRKNVLDRFF